MTYVRVTLVFTVGGAASAVGHADIPFAVFRAMQQQPRVYTIPMEGGPNAYLPALGCRYELTLEPAPDTIEPALAA